MSIFDESAAVCAVTERLTILSTPPLYQLSATPNRGTIPLDGAAR